MDFLQTSQGQIVNERGRPVRLRGVNLGNWLLLEGYMLGARNQPEHVIRQNLSRAIGASGVRSFFKRYQDRYIQTTDLDRIRQWGFTIVRAPVNYRLFFPSPVSTYYERNGWQRLDWLVRECTKRGLYILLDLHAAPGAQNGDWHSDSRGHAELWTSSTHQATLVRFWTEVAKRYRNTPALAGYDLLNEPILGDKKLLARVYQRCIKAIRAQKDRHILFLEGTVWSDDFSGLDTIEGEQLAYSPHFYKPSPFTFNVELDITYPGRIQKTHWDKQTLRKNLQGFAQLGKKTKRPILIGEFGVNTRCSVCHAETRWVRDCVDLFNEFGFHWTYWAYKVLSSHMHPSGLLRYPQNPVWFRREGNRVGWETWGDISTKDRQQLLAQMDSRHFRVDSPVLKALSS